MRAHRGLSEKLIDHFKTNPESLLTYEQIAARWPCTLQRARTTVWRLKEQGSVDSRHVIGAGPGLKS